MAARILEKEMEGDDWESSAPRLLVDSFAVELYLKCLYVLDTGKKPKKGHDWVRLFKALGPHTQEEIRKDFKRTIDQDPVLRNLDVINSDAVKLTDFNRSLEAAKNTFDKRRYTYEGFPKEEWYYGHLVHQAIRHVTMMDLRLTDIGLGKDSEP